MAKINGSAGTATFDSTEILITSWTVDITGEVINTTDSSDTTWMSNLASGFKSWTATCEGFQITGTADPAIGGAAASLVLELDGSRDYTGNAICTGINTVADVPGAEAEKKSFTFTGDGALTLTNA